MMLDEVEGFVGRFIAYPTVHARTAHTLWVAHCWFMDRWESTPRLAFLSPEPGSGKSRALEVTEPLVPRAVHAVNATPAYLFRKVSDPNGLPTILYDEADTVFGPRAKDNEDVRGMLNAGHRRGAVAGRCVIRGKSVETEDLPAYCAVALAGLGNLPDTILTRSVVIKMRRRAEGERVEPWRARLHRPQGEALAERLGVWAESVSQRLDWPEMPTGVEDRDADVWEALLAVADIAGGDWPERARAAAVALVAAAREKETSLGVTLLSDLREVFGVESRMTTDCILHSLHKKQESPWGDLRGKPLSTRRMADLLRPYGVEPIKWREGAKTLRGYAAADLADPWTRYLPKPQISATTATVPPSECVTCGEPLDGASLLVDAERCTDCEAVALVRERLNAADIGEATTA